MSQSKTLAELSEATGIPARTIRFYISRGLLEGPVKAGRGAVYTEDHVARLERIQRLQAEGRMLAEIARELNGGEQVQASAPPTAWWQHAIGGEVMVWVRGDLSPWRMRQIRTAVDEMAARLQDPREPGESQPKRRDQV